MYPSSLDLSVSLDFIIYCQLEVYFDSQLCIALVSGSERDCISSKPRGFSSFCGHTSA